MHVLAKSNTPTTQNKHLHKGFLLYEVFFIRERAMMNDDNHDSDDGDDDDDDNDDVGDDGDDDDGDGCGS